MRIPWSIPKKFIPVTKLKVKPSSKKKKEAKK